MKKLYLSILLVVIVGLLPAAATGCNKDAGVQKATASEATTNDSPFEKVTVAELTGNWSAYYHKKVEVTGVFRLLWPAVPACRPWGGDNPHIVEEYAPLRTIRYLVDNVAFKVMATTQNGTRYQTSLPAKEGETITVRGTVYPATINDYCDLDIYYRSLYIIADYNDITMH